MVGPTSKIFVFPSDLPLRLLVEQRTVRTGKQTRQMHSAVRGEAVDAVSAGHDELSPGPRGVGIAPFGSYPTEAVKVSLVEVPPATTRCRKTFLMDSSSTPA